MGGLKIIDQQVGTGPEAKSGWVVSVRYRGTFSNGVQFDASGDAPFRFPLGAGVVIAGWEQGILGMRVGGKRRLEIPPDLAYGEEGSPPEIPPKAQLIFEIELVAVTQEPW